MFRPIYIHTLVIYGWCKYLFIYCFTAQALKVCKTPGPTACSKTKTLHKVYLISHN